MNLIYIFSQVPGYPTSGPQRPFVNLLLIILLVAVVIFTIRSFRLNKLRKKNLLEIKEQADKNQGTNLCPACASEVGKSDKFCEKCGARLK